MGMELHLLNYLAGGVGGGGGMGYLRGAII